MTITLDQQIQAVAREIAMRRSAYPKWVASKRLTQAKADQEIAAMEAVLETLKGIRVAEPAAWAVIDVGSDELIDAMTVKPDEHDGIRLAPLYFNPATVP